MRKLLQAIFFREAPERGAFFGLTLLFVLPWLSIAVFALLFLRTEWLSLVDFDPTDWWCVGLLVGSIGFLMCLLASLARSIGLRRRWLRHTLQGCFLVAATGLIATLIYLFYLIYYESITSSFKVPGNWAETTLTGAGYVILLLSFYGLWLLLHCLGRAVRRHPRQSLKFVAALLCAIGFMVAYCICGEIWSTVVLGVCGLPSLLWFLYCLPRSRPAQCLGVCLLWYSAVDLAYFLIANCSSFLYGYTELRLLSSTPLAAVTNPLRTAAGVAPLAYLGAVFFLAAYLLTGWLMAKAERTTFRKLVGRGVLGVWLAVAAVYCVSVGLALGDQCAYRRTHAALVEHFGRPLKASELDRFYPPEPPHSAEFWEEVMRHSAALKSLGEKLAEVCPYYRRNYDHYVLSPEHRQQLRDLLDNSDLHAVEELLAEPLPAIQVVHRDDRYCYEEEHSDDEEYALLNDVAELEHWRLRFALEEREVSEAMRIFLRLKNICDWRCGQTAYDPSRVLRNETDFWLSVTRKMLSSGLGTPEWLREQKELLLSAEARLPSLIPTQYFYNALVCVNALEHVVHDNHLRIRALRWLAPPVWTSVVHLATETLQSHLEEKSGNYSSEFFNRFRDYFAARRLPRQLVEYRITRGFIAAERFRQQMESFPESLAALPADPYQPETSLRYAKTSVETNVQVWHEETYEGHECDCESCTPNCTCDQSSTYADWNTEARTIDVIKIWSVGPDGHDDGDAENTDDIGYYLWPAKYTGGLREGTE